MIQTEKKEYCILYYVGGRNKGTVECLLVERLDTDYYEKHGMRYWRWSLGQVTFPYNERCKIVDFVVLLPDVNGKYVGQYSIVTKNWSPDMLEKYAFCKVGMYKTEKHDGWV